MSESIATYAKELGVTPRQILRYIEEGDLIPSARRERPPMGRPFWVIDDVRPSAIMRLKLELSLRQRPEYRSIRATALERGATHPEIFDYLIHLVEELALAENDLLREDIDRPWYDETPDGLQKKRTAHAEKIQDFRESEARIWEELHLAAEGHDDAGFLDKLDRRLRLHELQRAAKELKIRFESDGQKPTVRNLATLMGISKSTLYRRFCGELHLLHEATGLSNTDPRTAGDEDEERRFVKRPGKPSGLLRKYLEDVRRDRD
ncbi:MAG TPA: hypothetical protein PLU30_07035 [Verrucomicrobiae bacterium]|nr:hypothetical protein [Verrucomicrobiae bacterium]